MESGVGDVGVSPFWGRYEGGWDPVDRDVYLQAAEHSGAVHSYSPHSGPMLRYVEKAGITGTNAKVGKVGTVLRSEARGGGLGCRWRQGWCIWGRSWGQGRRQQRIPGEVKGREWGQGQIRGGGGESGKPKRKGYCSEK